jgi:hypothetical protein
VVGDRYRRPSLLRSNLRNSLESNRGSDFALDPRVEAAIWIHEAFHAGEWLEALYGWTSEGLSDERLDFPDSTAIVPG